MLSSAATKYGIADMSDYSSANISESSPSLLSSSSGSQIHGTSTAPLVDDNDNASINEQKSQLNEKVNLLSYFSEEGGKTREKDINHNIDECNSNRNRGRHSHRNR